MLSQPLPSPTGGDSYIKGSEVFVENFEKNPYETPRSCFGDVAWNVFCSPLGGANVV